MLIIKVIEVFAGAGETQLYKMARNSIVESYFLKYLRD